MNVLVIGAAGKTGQLVVQRAVAAGHQVTAFVHDATTYVAPAGVRVEAGDATDPAAVTAAMSGQAAVIDTIGGKNPFLDSGVSGDTARAVVTAMHQQGVRRLIAISMLGVGDSQAHAAWLERLLLPTLLRGTQKDKTAMEAVVVQGHIDFVLVRPPILNDSAATGSVRVLQGEEKAHELTRPDLAQFLVDQLQHDTYLGQTITIANN